MKKTSKEYAEKIDSQEFFDLMQAYRMADPTNQEKVVQKFEAVKDYLKSISENNVEELIEALARAKDFLDRSESDEAQSLSFDIKFLIE